ncbi:hypothetical protein [Chondromyces crocatus]|uniref:hypothetical protein n=1 Tax=Chondromyces crocatus TaxID=52 RepID=UPI0012E2AA2A|nr:hypothetical protein [Chondromyces crocatus]
MALITVRGSVRRVGSLVPEQGLFLPGSTRASVTPTRRDEPIEADVMPRRWAFFT